jgi:hypothetical protein
VTVVGPAVKVVSVVLGSVEEVTTETPGETAVVVAPIPAADVEVVVLCEVEVAGVVVVLCAGEVTEVVVDEGRDVTEVVVEDGGAVTLTSIFAEPSVYSRRLPVTVMVAVPASTALMVTTPLE